MPQAPDIFQLLQGLGNVPSILLAPGMDLLLASLMGGKPGMPAALPESRFQTVPQGPPRPPAGPAEAGQNFGVALSQPTGLSPFGA